MSPADAARFEELRILLLHTEWIIVPFSHGRAAGLAYHDFYYYYYYYLLPPSVSPSSSSSFLSAFTTQGNIVVGNTARRDAVETAVAIVTWDKCEVCAEGGRLCAVTFAPIDDEMTEVRMADGMCIGVGGCCGCGWLTLIALPLLPLLGAARCCCIPELELPSMSTSLLIVSSFTLCCCWPLLISHCFVWRSNSMISSNCILHVWQL
uniref:Uncharacterized protein n=1 Tax=Anopheles atroparvus TaxID=41427 RepID=A0A182JKK4_ANOAO